MQAEIVNRTAGWVLGIESRIDPLQTDFKALWERRFMTRYEEIKKLAVDGAYYGAYYPCDEQGKVDFVAGMMTGEDHEVPQGLVKRPLPGGTYASIRCTMSNIGPTWNSIYREWLPSSAYQEDEARPAIEYYPPEMNGPDAQLTIFVAVKPKK